MVILDIETTGLNPEKCSIIEIGAVDFYNPTNQFNQRCRIRKDSEINERALEVNGYNLDQLRDNNFQTEKELLLKFINWISHIESRTLAGQNVNFDLSFLNASKKREKVEWNFGRRVVDIHSVAYAHMIKSNLKPIIKKGISELKGDAIMKYVGIPEEPKPHKGINGAIFETEALYRLLYEKSCFDELNKFGLKLR